MRILFINASPHPNGNTAQLAAALLNIGLDFLSVFLLPAAAFIIEMNLYCLIQGLGQTTTTFVGQNCGAKNLPRCFDITRQALAFLCSKSPKTKEPQKRKRRKRK